VSAAGRVNRLVREVLNKIDEPAFFGVFGELVEAMQFEVASLYGARVASIDELNIYLQREAMMPPELAYLRESDDFWVSVARKGASGASDLSVITNMPERSQLLDSAEAYIQYYRQLAIEC